MREIVVRLEADELERFRELDIDVRVCEASPSDLTWDRAHSTYRAMLDWWIRFHEKYDLEEEETYEVNPIDGVLYVDKD